MKRQHWTARFHGMPDALALEVTRPAVKQAPQPAINSSNCPQGKQQPTPLGAQGSRASSPDSPRPQPLPQHVRPRRGRHRCSNLRALSADCCWRCVPRKVCLVQGGRREKDCQQRAWACAKRRGPSPSGHSIRRTCYPPARPPTQLGVANARGAPARLQADQAAQHRRRCAREHKACWNALC